MTSATNRGGRIFTCYPPATNTLAKIATEWPCGSSPMMEIVTFPDEGRGPIAVCCLVPGEKCEGVERIHTLLHSLIIL